LREVDLLGYRRFWLAYPRSHQQTTANTFRLQLLSAFRIARLAAFRYHSVRRVKMAEYDPNRLPEAGQVQEPICPLCLEHNPIGEELCRRCRTPLVTITGPTLEEDDDVYRKPVALIGTWLISGPIAAVSVGLLIWGVATAFTQPISTFGLLDLFGVIIFFGLFAVFATFSCTALFRATRTFIRHRTERPRGFQPIMSDQSSDNPS
jgi:ribosomal protein L40E